MTKQQKCPSSCSGSVLVRLGVLCVLSISFYCPLKKTLLAAPTPLLIGGWSCLLGWLGSGEDVGLMDGINRLELVCIWCGVTHSD